MEEDGTPQIQEPDLEAWFLSRREWFPADPADENPLVWVERADQLGDKTLARRLLDDWAAGRPRDERTLSTLRWKLVDFGTYAEAADVMREMLSLKPNSASDLLHLAELERKAHRHDAAWESLQDCRRALENEDGWQDVGLGRFYIGELFLLAGAAPEPLSHVVFAQADREAPTVSRLAPVTLRAALDAARKIGHPSEAQYQHLRDAEDERIGRPPVDD
ncbi:hypothetical protein [Pseudonocardia sp. WMMC193]|uniref:hypothetical protein n=1 Tax=Pseudonocardia sp. WMMC193 TaxID=2911965 RepID=UPI001F38C5AC|nr:hypothetical protein [Pseudonocardia sp. WMMC193]MCF7551038.1 hypothetical protein [Pseudonocardia sp. WMMC193]